MKEYIGLMMILSAILIGSIYLFAYEFNLKVKILGVIFFEIFLALIIFGSYLMLE